MKYIIRREHVTVSNDGNISYRGTFRVPDVETDDLEGYRRKRIEELRKMGIKCNDKIELKFEYDTEE